MKELFIALAIVLIISQGCGNRKTEPNRFSSSMDTLKIETTKQKGSGLFSLGVSPGYFRDTTETFPYPIIYPEGIKDVKRMQVSTDFWAETKQYVDIIKGTLSEKKVFIVDQNNNNDLSDDSVRIYREIDWQSEEHLVECRYTIYRDGLISEETSWLRLGLLHDDIWCGKSEHLTAKFSIDKEEFQVGIIAPRSGDFTYKLFPKVALLSHNSIMKDSLTERDILIPGEVLKLKDDYYRIDSISHHGGYLTLVKENDFDTFVGIQIGMLAPDFTCLTVSGDTINSTSLHNRIMIIANSCGCGGDIVSTEAYYEILNKYGDKIHILRLDSRIDKDLEGNHVDMEDEFNKDIYNKYRKAYCSRTCYVIDRNNRIIDKFPIQKWNQYLPKIMSE